jgi:glucose-6-phosphate 1-dehydrogenase
MTQIGPTAFVIFGGGGDLTWRKLIPALYNLWLDKYLSEPFQVFCVDGKPNELNAFRQHLRDGIDAFSRQGKADETAWQRFAANIQYIKADFDDPAPYASLATKLDQLDEQWKVRATRLFYLSTPPTVVQMIATHLQQSGLTEDRVRARVVCEKPFGHDLDSAQALNTFLTNLFDEKQIYRIDHYLGKETVQNILAFRFANGIQEPLWNRRYIDSVQITVAEAVGVEHRGGYYDQSGALRDMIQNHLLQLLCLVAMEPPVSFEADELRNKKVDVLRAIRSIDREELARHVVRGQYGPGTVNGQRTVGYREEPGVNPKSTTETFVAVKLYVDNWRWQDVPFFLRTGKHLPGQASEICIGFRPVPHMAFPPEQVGEIEPNRLYLQIQPEQAIVESFQAKYPGPTMRLTTVETRFSYSSFNEPTPEAYETLLLDVMRGDATLFMRGDQVEAAWKVVMPILEYWEHQGPQIATYPAGSWGPEAASQMLARDGTVWVEPKSLQDKA